MRVLVVTVGGSDTPIVKSITYHKPDLVVFLCSETSGQIKGSRETVDGEGLVCKENICTKCGYRERNDRYCIVKQLGLTKTNYFIEIVEHDNPYSVYHTAENLIRKYLKDKHEVIVDYTGGTKSMSSGLAAAAMEYPECKLSVVKGPRLDLVKVREGMDRVAKLPSNQAFLQKQKSLCQRLIAGWDYQAAIRILDSMGSYGYLEDEPELERLLYLCRGFAAWDRFDYKNSVKYIEIYKDDYNIAPFNVLIKKINVSLDWYKEWTPEGKKNPPGFMLVYDVLLNAKRRSNQGSFDDAVSRFYRAIEMYAQFCLRTGKLRLNSENIDTSVLPEECRAKLECLRQQDKIMIGLKEDYELLNCIQHPVGPVWVKWKDKILSTLTLRNFSFLAHGMEPISERDYHKMEDIIWSFINECDSAQGFKEGLDKAKQLPVEM